jgi:hypothetical protein
MMRRVTNGRRWGWASAAAGLLGLGCGGSDDLDDSLFQPEPMPSEPVVAPLPPEDTMDDEMMAMMPPSMPVDVPVETPVVVPPVEEVIDPNAPCSPANGVSGRPENISQAIILLNTLPKPVTLECFLQALDRPLTIYMTSSDDSLQPSPGARSPRTFIINGPLVMSLVFDGIARDTLEFGYRPEVSRSIKAEIVFPLTRDVNERTLFDRVRVTERTTQCGICHVGEAHEDFPGFPLGVFASDVIVPFPMEEVSIEAMMPEVASCDAAAEEYRCGLLTALFEQGELVPGTLPEPE